MALAPADFYAYSRATGVPVPEDPEERAEMTPAVLEFRRNQLKAPQQESNPLAALGTVAAGLGLLAGGLYAAKRFGAGRAAVAPSKVPNLTQQGISDVSAVAKQQNAERIQRELSKQRPQGVVQTDLGFVDDLLNDPSLLSQVEYQEFTEGLTGTALSELRGAESRARNEYRGLVTEIGEEIRDQIIAEERAKVLSQTVGALESGEDQVTGRIMRGVQRNKNLDSSQVNQLKQQTGNVISATSLTPDGVPQDQTDLWGAATIPQIRQQQNDYGPSPLKLLPSSTQGRQQQAQSFLQQKREQLMQIFSPTRAERVLASDPAVAEAAELYASTGDPNVLSRFASAPSSPLTIKPMVQMAINQEELPTKFFFQPTGYPEYVGDLLEEDIELTNRISELGAQKQNLIDKASELGEQELMLRVAMEREPASGGAYTKMFAQVKNQQQNLPNPESLNVDLGDTIAQRDFVRNLMKSLQNLGSTYRLTNVQEGVRPYFEYDELNRIIPSTLELRGGRQSVDLGPKTGGGRLFAEYDPEGQTGSTKGIYGVEQTAKQSSAATRPTQLTMSELVREGLEQASASPEGDVPLPPSISQITERRPTAAAKRSLEASEIVRRAMIEGRDPQMVLRQRGFKV